MTDRTLKSLENFLYDSKSKMRTERDGAVVS